MRFGLAFFCTDETADPATVGRAAERAGFDSIFVTEHTHMPVDHSPHPSGEPLADVYKRSLDPFVVLSAIASVTTTLRLGFGVSLIGQRDPIVTAKAVASLDWASGGRVDFGIGAGWNEPEYENHGRPFNRRFKVMREHVEAMRAIWTSETASYAGEFVNFGPLWSWPKPVQTPLPVYVGGNGPRVLDRVIRYGDHWMPNRERPDLPTRGAELRLRAEEAGRPRPQVAYFGVPPEPAAIERFRGYGLDQGLLIVKSAPPGEVEELIGRAGELIA